MFVSSHFVSATGARFGAAMRVHGNITLLEGAGAQVPMPTLFTRGVCRPGDRSRWPSSVLVSKNTVTTSPTSLVSYPVLKTWVFSGWTMNTKVYWFFSLSAHCVTLLCPYFLLSCAVHFWMELKAWTWLWALSSLELDSWSSSLRMSQALSL